MKASRKSAAAIHLAVSVVLATAVGAFIFFVWYPGALFDAVGGQGLLLIIAGVDVCLGPLLTLIVFNPSKQRRLLVLDLSIIAALQVSALLYGLYATFEARPVFLAYGQGKFVAVTANELDGTLLKAAGDPKFQTLPLMGPRLVGTRQPTGFNDLSELSFVQAMTGMGIHYLPRYYVDIADVRDDIVREAKTLDQLRSRHPQSVAVLDRSLARLGREADSVKFIALRTKRRPLTMLVDSQSGAVLDTLLINPD